MNDNTELKKVKEKIWEENVLTEQEKKSLHNEPQQAFDTTTETKKSVIENECNDIGRIYIILNKINNKYQPGSTIQPLNKRWDEHKKFLRRNKHWNHHLQRAWNKYGDNTFEFHIVELIYREENESRDDFSNRLRKEYEQKYLDWANSHPDTNYNIAKDAIRPISWQGRRHTEESRKKMSEYHKGRRMGKENSFYGKHHTEESKQKNRDAHMGKKMSKEFCKKMSNKVKGENHHFYGKHLSEEMKSKIRETHKRISHLPIDKKIYHWVNEGVNLTEKCLRTEMMEKYNHLKPSSVSMLINGIRKSYKGWKVINV